MKIKVLFEDGDVIVLDKPAYLSVHADGKRQEYTLADYLLEYYPDLKGVGENVTLNEAEISRPGIVHRLDKDTSGCILISKNQKSYNSLKSQFQNHTIKKEYTAIVYGWPKNESGIIDLPIARSRDDFRKQAIAVHAKGGDKHRGEEREAVTRYKVIEQKVFIYKDEKDIEKSVKLSIVKFYPMSGRMHQIRVHAKSINHPIVGDCLYGKKDIGLEKALFKGGKGRQLLHAFRVTFETDSSGVVSVESPPPIEFALG